jgi:hypothetical protein
VRLPGPTLLAEPGQSLFDRDLLLDERHEPSDLNLSLGYFIEPLGAAIDLTKSAL